LDAADYEESTIQLNPGDRLYLFSDGLIEERNDQSDLFGDQRLLQNVSDHLLSPLSDSVTHLIRSVVDWHGNDHLSDDISIIGVEMKNWDLERIRTNTTVKQIERDM
jgi:sigma-B regulation protein RsbU (phosphoserine phosphatase)